MPTGSFDTGIGIRNNRRPIGRHCRCAVDDQAARRMIERQHKELFARRGIEHVRERDLQWLGEGGDPGRLNRNVEGMLQHTGRQHVLHQLFRHGTDTDLHVGQRLAIRADSTARSDREGQRLPLLIGQIRRRVGIDRDRRRRGIADSLQNVGLQPGQIHFLAVEIGQPLLVIVHRHAAHDGVGNAGK